MASWLGFGRKEQKATLANNNNNIRVKEQKAKPEARSQPAMCNKAQQCNLPIHVQTCGPHCSKNQEYVKSLEKEHDMLQGYVLTLTSQIARMQFYLRQLIDAGPEQRKVLLHEMSKIAFRDGKKEERQANKELVLNREAIVLKDIRQKQHQMVKNLRVLVNTLQPATGNGTVSNVQKSHPKGSSSGSYCHIHNKRRNSSSSTHMV